MKKPELVWSEYQKAIFKDIQSGVGNTIILARAGSAKTSSLVECVKYIPKKSKVLFCAFNKRIAQELDERIDKSYIDIRTLHSRGLSTIRNAFGSKVKLDPDKGLNICIALLHEKGFKKFDNEKFNIAFSMHRVVNICKGSLVDTPSKIDEILYRFDIDTFDMEREEFVKSVCQVLRKCKETKEVIDFADMVCWPFLFNIPIEQYDMVFIDEAQDLTPAQLHIAISSCKKNGRIIAAGDDRQVLYSWAGVELDTIEKLIKRLNAKVLSLPISYRCAKAIVKYAQEIVPDIQAAPNAIEGDIHYINEELFLNEVKEGDFILSRINAPLIYYCMQLLRKGKKANVAGRDVANSLSWLIKKSEKKTVPDFLIWLAEWKKSEIARLEAKNRDPILITDKAACLENLCEDAKSLDEVLDNIKTLFRDGDDIERVILSSVHRAKGLERKRVFLLDNFRLGMNVEENNVVYVGRTRAKETLYIVRE